MAKGRQNRLNLLPAGRHFKDLDLLERREYSRRYQALPEVVNATIKQRKLRGIVDPSGDRPVGECLICKKVGPLVADHNHVTGELRGWPCRACNLTLGRWGDNAEIVRRALKYLVDSERFHRTPKHCPKCNTITKQPCSVHNCPSCGTPLQPTPAAGRQVIV